MMAFTRRSPTSNPEVYLMCACHPCLVLLLGESGR